MRKLLLGWAVLMWSLGWGGAVLSNDKMIMKNRAINIPAKVNQTIVVWQLLV